MSMSNATPPASETEELSELQKLKIELAVAKAQLAKTEELFGKLADRFSRLQQAQR